MVAADGAPVPRNAEALVKNIELQAKAAVDQIEEKSEATLHKAAFFDKKVVANKKFANAAADKLGKAVHEIDEMQSQEKKVDVEMQEVEVEVDNVRANKEREVSLATIVGKDRAANLLSQKIQDEARHLKANVDTLEHALKTAKVPAKKPRAAELGEANAALSREWATLDAPKTIDDFEAQVKGAEDDAEAAVTHANQQAVRAHERVEGAKQELERESQLAQKAFGKIRQSEERLALDLHGHSDTDLEGDILALANTLQHHHHQRKKKKKALGESMEIAPGTGAGLQAAEDEAEKAVLASEAEEAAEREHAEEERAFEERPEVVEHDPAPTAPPALAGLRAAERAAHTATDPTHADTVDMADLSAIDADAHKVQAFEAGAVHELDTIKKWLH
jgi:hypothetical protein